MFPRGKLRRFLRMLNDPDDEYYQYLAPPHCPVALCCIQKATKQVITLFNFVSIFASFHHFPHVLLLETRGRDETSARMGTPSR